MHKIALIGAGRIGRIHAANVASQPGLDLACVVDRCAHRGAPIRSRRGACRDRKRRRGSHGPVRSPLKEMSRLSRVSI
jgi:predicted homoserine dehydrogenase-like protein